MVGTVLLVVAIVFVVGSGVREAWRRDVSGAAGSLCIALLILSLRVPTSRATWVLLALSVGCLVWSFILGRNRSPKKREEVTADRPRWARVPPALAWRHPGLPTTWTRVLERNPEAMKPEPLGPARLAGYAGEGAARRRALPRVHG